MVRRAAAALLLLAAAIALPALPAAAESACMADPTGDVNGQQPGVDTNRADIVAACVDHSAEHVVLTLRTAAPVDPATFWDGSRGALGFAIDTDGDGLEDYNVNLAAFDDGPLTFRVFQETTLLCEGEGGFDQTTYRAALPRDCLGDPDEVSVAAYLRYGTGPDQDGQELTDQVPPFDADGDGVPDYIGPLSTDPDPETAVTRLQGPSRVETALAVSQSSYPDGGASVALLARADAFPDALAGAPLAVAADGPILLTQPDGLRDDVREELERVLAPGATVYLLGGETALSEQVAEDVEDAGFDAVRAAGDTRYATAAAIAAATTPTPTAVFLADGNAFPSALIAGSVAAFEGAVTLLTNGNALGPDVEAYLDSHPDVPVVAVGSVAAEAAAGIEGVHPIEGADSFATSVLVAQERYPEATGVAIASGTAFPDGLTGGAHAARLGVPLLLSWPDVLPSAVTTHLEDHTPIGTAALYGGTVALSHHIERTVAGHLAE